ncbi:hypothetical protein F2P79_002658 [Pimephales promelas]|nr:hypothetical protein F2P79_002658 [Pimephales promelas]
MIDWSTPVHDKDLRRAVMVCDVNQVFWPEAGVYQLNAAALLKRTVSSVFRALVLGANGKFLMVQFCSCRKKTMK